MAQQQHMYHHQQQQHQSSFATSSSSNEGSLSLLNLQGTGIVGGNDRLPPPTPTPTPSLPMAHRALKMAPKSAANSHLSPADEDMNPELWYACAGPQHVLPPLDSLVAYFPQGHIEQVASFNNPDVRGYTPRYDLPAPVPCQLTNIQLSADPDTDEVFATVTLVPVDEPMSDSSLRRESQSKPRQKSVSFVKKLTVSDTSTHGGFSVPRRGAEDCFPPLDKTRDNPIQDLVAKDLHGNEWKFRHLFRGQPKRHLLTTGWSVFVSQKRLVAGDTVLFLRDANGQLRIAVRLAPRQQKPPAIMVTSSMAIGVLEAAGHAVAEKSRFSLIYNPRSSPSQFIIPYSKYLNSLKHNFTVGQRIRSEFSGSDMTYSDGVKPNSAIGHRSRARFESEDSSFDNRSTGTIVEISDYDQMKWHGSAWRSVQVKWDESSHEKHERVSPWEITPFTPCATLPPQDRPRKPRYKPVGPMTAAQPSPGLTLSPGAHFARPEPLPAFGGLDLLGLQRHLDGQQQQQQQHQQGHLQQAQGGEAVDFGLQVYNAYKHHCDVGPLSPRMAALHPFVKDEPLRDMGLQLGVPSSSAAKEQQQQQQFNNLQQRNTRAMPSLAVFRDPSPSWGAASSYRSYSDARPSASVNGPDCTVLSMNNLPVDTGSSSRTPSGRPNLWEAEKPVAATTAAAPPPPPAQGEQKCMIFGVSLDTSSSVGPAGEGPSSNVGREGGAEMVSTSLESCNLTPRAMEAWQRGSGEADWQLKLATEHRSMDHC